MMDQKKRQELEAQGWEFGSVKEFLDLSPDEVAYIESRIGDMAEKNGYGSADNPLLNLAALGVDGEPMDLSNSKDEEILRDEIHPIYGWSSKPRDDG